MTVDKGFDVCSIPNRVDGRSFYVKNINYSRCSSVKFQLLKLCREEGVNLLEGNSSDIPTVGRMVYIILMLLQIE